MARRFVLVPAVVLTLTACVTALFISGESRRRGDAPARASVTMDHFRFGPATATVKAGGVVTWQNDGTTLHNVKGSDFFLGAAEPGESFGRRFDRPGSYEYVCTLHAGMRGRVIVKK